jgi:hypothetical protein
MAFCAALLSIMILSCSIVAAQNPSPTSPSQDTPEPIIIPHPHYEYAWIAPKRPQDANEIHVAMGIFDHYEYISAPAEQFLVVRDPKTAALTRFLLSTNTTLNGKPLPCLIPMMIGVQQFCEQLPSDVFRRGANVAVLYWKVDLPEFDFNASDTIVSVPS